MQQVMCIGDKFVPADDDIKDITKTSMKITDVAKEHKTDLLAVISKGDVHHLVTQYHTHDTKLKQDLMRIISLIESVADTYKVNVIDMTEAIKIIINEGA